MADKKSLDKRIEDGVNNFLVRGFIVVCFAIVFGLLVCVGKFLVDASDMTMPMDGWQFVVCLVGAVLVLLFLIMTPLGKGIVILAVAICVLLLAGELLPGIWHAIVSSPDTLSR